MHNNILNIHPQPQSELPEVFFIILFLFETHQIRRIKKILIKNSLKIIKLNITISHRQNQHKNILYMQLAQLQAQNLIIICDLHVWFMKKQCKLFHEINSNTKCVMCSKSESYVCKRLMHFLLEFILNKLSFFLLPFFDL